MSKERQLTEEQWEEIEAMGIKISVRTGEAMSVDANEFALFVSKRYRLLYKNSDFYKYEDEIGKWIKLDEMKVKTSLRNILHRYYRNLWNRKLENEYVEALKRIVYFDGEFNQEKSYINMKNGMYNLETDSFISHHYSFYSTIQIPVIFDKNATCPRFKKFLEESFLGDDESILLAEEWLGYSMTTDTKAQKALILYAKGCNGKGVYTHVLGKCIGKENISNLTVNDLSNSFMRSYLHNKGINICNEIELGGKNFNTQYFKLITGEDEIMAEEKHKQPFSFKPTVKLIYSTNNLPYTKDITLGFKRRLSILYFRNTLKEQEIDIFLKEKLDSELSGIFNLGIEALKRLRDNQYRFTRCTISENVLAEYEKDINPMVTFFEECIEKTDADNREDKKIIYNTFKSWAIANGLKSYAEISTRKFWTMFNDQMKSLDYDYKIGRSNAFYYCTGIRVVGEYKTDSMSKVKSMA